MIKRSSEKEVDIAFVIANTETSFLMGAGIIVAILKKNNFNVHVIDGYTENLIPETVVRELSVLKPKVIAFTALMGGMASFQRNVSIGVRALMPSTPQIAGGWWATSAAEQLLKNTSVDYAVRGEADLIIAELCSNLINDSSLIKSPSISYLDKNGVYMENALSVFPQNLDLLPYPAYEMFNMDYYSGKVEPNKVINPYFINAIKRKHFHKRQYLKKYNMMSGRGCYAACTFCGAAQLARRNYSPKNLVDHLEYMINEYGADIFIFTESLTLSTRKWVKQFCNEIIYRKLNILYSGYVRGDFNYDDETLSLLFESGLFHAEFGIESGSNRMLESMGKNVKIDVYRKTINDFRRHGIQPGGSFIINMPGETRESLKETISFVKKSKVAFKYGNAYPYMGSELYNYVKSKSLVDNNLINDIFSNDSKTMVRDKETYKYFFKHFNYNNFKYNELWKILKTLDKYRLINRFYSQNRIFMYWLTRIFPVLLTFRYWLKRLAVINAETSQNRSFPNVLTFKRLFSILRSKLNL